jgi:tetratricopeptide (TPR) repeat protein
MSSRASSAPRPAVAFGIVLAMLALPLLYVAFSHSHGQSVRTQSSTWPTQAVPPAPSLAELEHLASSDPTSAHRLNFSQALIDHGLQGRAIIVLNALIADEPMNTLAWNNLCVAHSLQQEYNLAVPACESGVRIDPSAQIIRNNLKWAQDERAHALQALAAQESTPGAQRTPAFYLAEGLNYLHLGNYDQAIGAWRQCLRLDHRNADAQNNIGIAQMMQSRYKEADASFREALTLNPGSQLAKNNLAWAMEEEKNAH